MNKISILLFFQALLITSIFGQIDPCDFKDKTAISNNKKVTKLYGKAKKLQLDKKKSEALNVLYSAIELDPECAKCRYSAAKILDRKGKIQKALEQYMEIDQTCEVYKADLYFNIGSISYLRSKSVADDDPELLRCAEFYGKFLEHGNSKKSKYQRAALKCRECINLYELYADTVPFNPKKLKGVSENGSDEYLPFVAPDNETMYYSKKYKVEPKGLTTYSKNAEWKTRLYKASMHDNQAIANEEMTYPFNEKGIEQGAATLTINNNEMYITICGEHPLNIGYCDIFYTKKVNGVWQDLQNMNDLSDYPINTESYESMPSISSDGKVLYFVSDRHDLHLIKRAEQGDRSVFDKIDYDIYFTTKQENGKWAEPKRMGPSINSEKDEKTPFIHPDNRTLYFSSAGHYGIGGYDIFYSRKDKNGKWDFAKNIGIPINTVEDDGDFFASLDGQTGYFASKPSGIEMWEIFQFSLYEEAQPKKLVLLKGKVVNEDGLEGTNLKIRNNNTGQEVEIEVNKQDGSYAYIAQIDDSDETINDNISSESSSNIDKIDSSTNETTSEKTASNASSKKLDALKKLDAIKAKLKTTEELEEIIENFPISPEDTASTEKIEISSNPSKHLPKTGKIKYVDIPKKKSSYSSFTLSSQKKGSFMQSATIKVDSKNSNSLQKFKLENKKITKGSKFTIDNLLFETDSYELSIEAKNELRTLIDFLTLNNTLSIGINGHTDNIGSTAKNLTLSSNRAKAVFDYLIESKIDKSRLSYKGYGSSKPLTSNSTIEGRKKNRRTEIVIK